MEDRMEQVAAEMGITTEEAKVSLESAEAKTLSYYNLVEDMKKEHREKTGTDATDLTAHFGMVESFIMATAIWEPDRFREEDENGDVPTFCGLKLSVNPFAVENEVQVLAVP